MGQHANENARALFVDLSFKKPKSSSRLTFCSKNDNIIIKSTSVDIDIDAQCDRQAGTQSHGRNWSPVGFIIPSVYGYKRIRNRFR